MKDNSIMVSVICNTYNHGKYIAQALESMVNQKTDFYYEIIVHDDASTDETSDIVHKYAKQYPDIIKPVFEESNQYHSGTSYLIDIHLPLCRGKYITFCEGDDFWTDRSKLQEQFEYMEDHQGCAMCVHRAIRVDESGKYISEYADYSMLHDDGATLSNDFVIRNTTYFPFNSLFTRKEFIDKHKEFLKQNKVYDYGLKTLLATEGETYILNKSLSAYRLAAEGSWTERISQNDSKMISHLEHSLEVLDSINKYTNYICNDSIMEEIILREAKILLLRREYRELISKKYKNALKSFRKKVRLKIYLGAVSPRLTELIR